MPDFRLTSPLQPILLDEAAGHKAKMLVKALNTFEWTDEDAEEWIKAFLRHFGAYFLPAEDIVCIGDNLPVIGLLHVRILPKVPIQLRVCVGYLADHTAVRVIVAVLRIFTSLLLLVFLVPVLWAWACMALRAACSCLCCRQHGDRRARARRKPSSAEMI